MSSLSAPPRPLTGAFACSWGNGIYILGLIAGGVHRRSPIRLTPCTPPHMGAATHLNSSDAPASRRRQRVCATTIRQMNPWYSGMKVEMGSDEKCATLVDERAD